MATKAQAKKIAHKKRQQKQKLTAAANKVFKKAKPLGNSTNVVWLQKSDASPEAILKAGAIAYRACNEGSVVLKCPPSELTDSDVAVLNAACDRHENNVNRTVKTAISEALTDVFNERSIKLFEIGPGSYPITPYFEESSVDIEYHGIECDTAHIKELRNRGYSASHCNTITSLKHADDKPSIVTSIYALQFLINEDFSKHMNHLITEDGVFIGNFYLYGKEQELRKRNDPESARARLETILKSANLNYLVLADKAHPTNEYWVISKPGNQETMHELGKAVTSRSIRAWQHCPSLTNFS